MEEINIDRITQGKKENIYMEGDLALNRTNSM